MKFPLFGAAILITTVFASAETAVHITGLRDKSESQVLGLMGGRLAQVRANDASPYRADDAAFLVTQVLRKDGYANVQVDWKIVNRTNILLKVNAGGRLSLGEVKISGVPAADAQLLAKLYDRPAEKDSPLGAGNPPFREQDVETGISYIKQQLNSEGYWSADATISNRKTDPVTGVVSLAIDVNRGPAYTIGAANFTSPDGRGVPEAREAAEPSKGKPATTGNVNAMRLAVAEAFRSKGYPDSKITMSRTLDSPRFVPLFTIDIGKRVQLEKVLVDGAQRTRPGRVVGRFKSLEKDWYDEAAMNKRIRGLLATGAFTSVRLEKTPVGEDSIDATLHLEEAKAKEITGGIGVDSYQGVFLRTTYADRNLGGQLLGFRTGFEFSARGVLGETSLTDPWLFGTDVSGTARVYALIYGREGYTSLETGLDGKVSYKIGDHYTLEALAGYSIVSITAKGLPASALGETSYTHPRLRLTQTLDFRDSPILPTKGWHVENPVEIGAAVGNTSTAYFKSGLSGGWYHPINKDYQVALGGDIGFLIPSGDGTSLPIDLRLFNGGSRSVRSFPERDLGPQLKGYATGGEAAWTANAELIRSLGGSLKAVGFFDAGTLASSFDQIGSSEVELAVGLGLRLDLPIGPVRLEYGYNLTRNRDEPIGTLHFAIGIAF